MKTRLTLVKISDIRNNYYLSGTVVADDIVIKEYDYDDYIVVLDQNTGKSKQIKIKNMNATCNIVRIDNKLYKVLMIYSASVLHPITSKTLPRKSFRLIDNTVHCYSRDLRIMANTAGESY